MLSRPRWVAALLVGVLCGCDPPPQASPMHAVANPEPGYDFAAEEKQYLDELDRLRTEAGLEKVDRVGDGVDEGVVVRTTEEIRSGRTPVDEALYGLIEHFSKKTTLPFSAATYVPEQLNGWPPEYPPELLQRPHMAAVVSIAHTGSQYVVMVIYGDLDYTP